MSLLYDGHTKQEWESIGYDVECYDYEDFPLKWDEAIKYGQCKCCGCIDHLAIAAVLDKQIMGICNECIKDNY